MNTRASDVTNDAFSSCIVTFVPGQRASLQHRVARGLELVARLPFRELRGVGDAVADRNSSCASSAAPVRSQSGFISSDGAW